MLINWPDEVPVEFFSSIRCTFRHISGYKNMILFMPCEEFEEAIHSVVLYHFGIPDFQSLKPYENSLYI